MIKTKIVLIYVDVKNNLGLRKQRIKAIAACVCLLSGYE